MTRRAWPSFAGKTFVIIPFGQLFRGSVSSTITITSPTEGGFVFSNHLLRRTKLGQYSRAKPRQKCLANFCVWCHRCRRSWLCSNKGLLPAADLSRRWFGVKGSSSNESRATNVSGREFMMNSTSNRAHLRDSSLNLNAGHMAFIFDLIVLTSRSHTPPICVAAGELNHHLISSYFEESCRRLTFSSRMIFSKALKLVPFPVYISLLVPILMKFCIHIIYELVPRLCTTSIWSARNVRQVNSTPHLFSLHLPTVTYKGPKSRY